MEPSALTIGMPKTPGRKILFAGYNEDSSMDTLVEINQAGAICATAFNSCSDERYKRLIIPLENSLDKIVGVRGVSYHWDQQKWPNKFSEKRQIGFIAQEVEKIFS